MERNKLNKMEHIKELQEEIMTQLGQIVSLHQKIFSYNLAPNDAIAISRYQLVHKYSHEYLKAMMADILWNRVETLIGKSIGGQLRNNTLDVLYLYNISVGDEGSKYISRVLEENKSVTRVVLFKNGITSKGAKNWVKVLKNKQITHFYLNYNSIGPEGGDTMNDALKEREGLKELSLISCDMGEGVRDKLRVTAGKRGIYLETEEIDEEE
jgi:hypothetical protein